MPNSVRHQIMDQVLSLLTNITTVNGYSTTVASVSEHLPGSIEQIKLGDMPACYPIDADEEHSRDEIGTGTGDCAADLTVVVTCVVFSKTDSTRTARTNLIRDVEKAFLSHAGLAALCEWVDPGTVTTDRGAVPNYSIWDQEFTVHYRYSSSNGG